MRGEGQYKREMKILPARATDLQEQLRMVRMSLTTSLILSSEYD
jgi:hypothetical protein